ncbi:CMP-N-acetylneuraminate-beta-galactosamide-alpha-2,3-sialyltransferase 1-like [Plectropomus leopardus]|uniref:CMP-N-acetylneuraminate-beta-galactosamide- alpha-2,3-sialyltransferase 1-like n=1 Tax=Plectropomus leopardus TaxID=160734 RepID=UPI001C4B7AB7|nr:CMP-N-acetylneuraminate-beta-galactosamide-alpha-2,3-sialyltransferase 1-like [Plectropomus leopardus]XP_042362539.1 CMP-N-acetylneuraminate-beta-galactosamide-alpha-2,3-sialyltransferase 1-like [Plectropomus leopardus]XP_042362540.1 CMP-N-acetylneuraminate-beta-galactosamide-alpha-2,3-sialyltransferase 1-like [Plectropomus leopardus]
MNSKVRVLLFVLSVTGMCVFWRAYLLPYSPPQLESPCACERCLSEKDQWFTQRFNKFVEPFLSANYSLSEDAFNWWKHLQTERRNFTTYRKTVNRMFQMLSPKPDVVEPSPDRCRSCAVVGNSGNLRRSHYGPLIDFHDIIIRMNTAHTKGYEADVGTRTTHRIMYPESAVDLDSTTHLVLVPFKIQDIEWVTKALTTGFTGKSYMPVKSKIKANKDLVMVVNPAFMRYVHDIWLGKKGRYPSTGFMALILALHICDEVNVFGYGADSEGNWSHYWEKLGNRHLKTGVHPGNHEYGIIEELAAQQIVTFYRGW